MRRRRQGRRDNAYQKVLELHDEDEPPFLQHNTYRDSSTVESSYELRHVPDTPSVPEEHHIGQIPDTPSVPEGHHIGQIPDTPSVPEEHHR